MMSIYLEPLVAVVLGPTGVRKCTALRPLSADSVSGLVTAPSVLPDRDVFGLPIPRLSLEFQEVLSRLFFCVLPFSLSVALDNLSLSIASACGNTVRPCDLFRILSLWQSVCVHQIVMTHC